jgi:hypothetical protein
MILKAQLDIEMLGSSRRQAEGPPVQTRVSWEVPHVEPKLSYFFSLHGDGKRQARMQPCVIDVLKR